MPARNRHRERVRAARTLARERARPGPPGPEEVLSDRAWEYAPRNGNPLPLRSCGGVHHGPCCSCAPDYCCYRL